MSLHVGEAAQTLYHRAINANRQALAEGRPLPEHKALMDALALVVSGDFDPAFRAILLQMPSETDVWAEEEILTRFRFIRRVKPYSMPLPSSSCLNGVS